MKTSRKGEIIRKTKKTFIFVHLFLCRRFFLELQLHATIGTQRCRLDGLEIKKKDGRRPSQTLRKLSVSWENRSSSSSPYRELLVKSAFKLVAYFLTGRMYGKHLS